MRPVGEPRISVYVWDPVVRITHWVIVLTILLLSATGFYIGRPFVSPQTHPFFTGWVKVVHSYSAMAFALSVLVRIIWMFVGTPWARWSQLVPTTRQRLRDMFGTFKFYVFLRREPPPCVGHNALAGATYLMIFGIYLAMILTGFAIYGASAHVGSPMRWLAFLGPLFGGLQTMRWIHHVGMYLLLGFMVHHIYSAWLMSRMERNATLDSIFTGFKALPTPENEEHHG
jgi:Ni/Fe-hydrogenase 1 B-type cytochrome subunit